jgi:putative transposase
LPLLHAVWHGIVYSLRQVFRFFANDFDWYLIRNLIFNSFFYEQDKGILHQIYQLQARNKSYTGTILNIVVIQTRKVKEEKVSLTLIFSNDVSLDAHTLMDYYSLRFQIEFDFRDAKQYFGLSDFKNYQEKNVENFTNMIFTMTLISKKILQDLQKEKEKFSLLDLKLLYHGQFQAQNIIYILQNDPDLIFNPNILQEITH